MKQRIKQRISWFLLLWTTFLILITFDWRNLKYFLNLTKELHKLFKRNTFYTEDSGFVLIHKSKLKNL